MMTFSLLKSTGFKIHPSIPYLISSSLWLSLKDAEMAKMGMRPFSLLDGRVRAPHFVSNCSSISRIFCVASKPLRMGILFRHQIIIEGTRPDSLLKVHEDEIKGFIVLNHLNCLLAIGCVDN